MMLSNDASASCLACWELQPLLIWDDLILHEDSFGHLSLIRRSKESSLKIFLRHWA